MRRRSFLLGLLAAPFAPLAAKLAPGPQRTLLDVAQCVDPGAHMLPVTEALCRSNAVLGSDQTSIWICDWSPQPMYQLGHRVAMRSALPQVSYWQQPKKKNWLREAIRGV